MGDICSEIWRQEVIGEETKLVPLPIPERLVEPPHNHTQVESRKELSAAQLTDPETAAIIAQKRPDLDP